MNRYLIVGGIVLISFIVALIFEDSRDYIFEIFEYIISFEWTEDIADFFSSMFEDIGEFSIYGLIFGIISAGTILYIEFYTRFKPVSSFTDYLSPLERVFWNIATYVGCFVGGYFMGKFFENTA